jgi:hypothetical protein
VPEDDLAWRLKPGSEAEGEIYQVGIPFAQGATTRCGRRRSPRAWRMMLS